jgi:hypothetical protein
MSDPSIRAEFNERAPGRSVPSDQGSNRARATTRTRFSIAALLAACLSAAPSIAQDDWRVQGSVLDALSGQPIEGAVVSAGDLRVTTDAKGGFEIIPVTSSTTLQFEAPGYLDTRLAVDSSGPRVRLEVRLFPRNDFVETVQVRARPPEDEEPSAYRMAPNEVLQVAGSVDNIFRTLDTLPGVASVEDFGSRLSVRGGSPDQNLTIMDGVEIHDPFRLSGLTSAFNPEIIDHFELTAGGFGAKYGDRLSSILVVDNRVPSRTFGGTASVSVTDANVVAEGAIPGTESGSWLLTGRRTYYDLVAGITSDNRYPSFDDLQAQASLALGPKRRLSFVGLRSRERSDFDVHRDKGEDVALVTDAGNDLVSASLDWLSGPSLVSTTTLAWYRNRDAANVNGTIFQMAKRSNAADDDVALGLDEFIFDRWFLVSDGSLREDLSWQAASSHTLELGAELHLLSTEVRWESLGEDRNLQEANGSSVRGGAGLPDFVDSTLSSNRGGAWIQDRWRVSPGISLEPGLRFDWSTANQRSTLSPRFAARFDLGPGTALRAAIGRYTQSPGYEKLIHADYFVDLGRAAELEYEDSTHVVLGVEREIGPGFVARFEGYYKSFSDLVVGRLETDAERLARIARYDFPEELRFSIPTAPIITTVPSNDSGGRAYGLDFYLARVDPAARISGWISYTLGKAERDAYSRTYPLEYDRRHSLDVVGRYRWSERFDIAVTARLASGFPYTPAVGLRVASTEDERGMLVPEFDSQGNLVYAADFGTVANLNSGRMPPYARVDLRATFRPGGFAGRWSFYVEAINLFNRDNAVRLETWLVHDPGSEFPRIIQVPEEGFPLLPSAGVRFRF